MIARQIVALGGGGFSEDPDNPFPAQFLGLTSQSAVLSPDGSQRSVACGA